MEYWMFNLLNFLVIMGGAALGGFFSDGNVVADVNPVFLWGLTIYLLVTLPPGLAVEVRRLHDIGYSGWWYFIDFFPVIGPIFSLFLTIISGTKGPNRYGPDPKDKNIVVTM